MRTSIQSLRESYLRGAVVLLALGCQACTARHAIAPGEIPSAKPPTKSQQEKGAEIANKLRTHFRSIDDKAVVQRISNITSRLLKTSKVGHTEWEIHVLKGDAIVNAASSIGNRIFIWSGMVRLATTDGELAAILSHEIGHTLAGHHDSDTLESITEGFTKFTSQVGSTAASSAQTPSYGYGMNDGAAALGSAAVALTSLVITKVVQKAFIEPESRRKEFEADSIGLFIMAEAGYSPEEAVNFWKRLTETQRKGESKSFLLFQTHPSSEKRLARLRELLPEAMKRYEASSMRHIKTSSQVNRNVAEQSKK